MALLPFLRPRPALVTKPPALRSVTPARPLRAAPAPAEELALDGLSLAEAWRPAERLVLVPADGAVGPGRRVALKLQGDVGVTAPVLGTVTGVRGPEGARVAEVRVDADGAAILRRVVDYLQGQSTQPKARAPRYRVALPAVVATPTAHLLLKTTTISVGGCGLLWNASRPASGTYLELRLGAGSRAAQLRGRICWVRPEQTGFRVGVKFLAGDLTGLKALVAEHASTEAES